MDSKRTKKIIITAGKIVFIVAALVYVFSKIDVSQMFSIFAHANYFFLLLAAILFFVSKIMSAWRHKILLKSANVLLTHPINYKLYWLGMFYNLFLPGGIGGDGYKVWWLQKHFEVKTKNMIGALLLDRLSGMHAVFVLVLMFLAFVPEFFIYQQYVGLLILPAYVAMWFLIYWVFTNYRSNFWQISVLSLCLQGAQLFAAFIMLHAFGVTDGFSSYLLVFLASSLAIVLPLSVGGVGLRELVFLYGATLLGLNVEISIALSLTVYFISAIISLPGIYCVLRPIVVRD